MKKFFQITISLIATISAFAEEPKAPLDPEIEANNAKCMIKIAEAKATYDWGVAKFTKPKFSYTKFYHKPDFKKIAADMAEVEDLVKQGKTTVATIYELKRILANAYADQVNLAHYDDAVAAYDAAIALATTDADRLNTRLARAKYMLKAAQVDPSGPMKELDEMYASLPDNEKLKRMVEFPGHDYNGPEGRALAEKVGDNELAAWYRKQVVVKPINQDDPLDERNSFDYKLKLCDEAIAKFPNSAGTFIDCKCVLWRAMNDFDSAEKALRERLEKITAERPDRRCSVLHDLATLYVARASRYYAAPDEKLSREALKLWDEAFSTPPEKDSWGKNGRKFVCEGAVKQAILIRDYELASKWLDRYTEFKGEAGAKDPWICACRGDLAYYAGNYAEAVKWYETPENDFADAPSSHQFPNSHQRYAGALNAIGEYEKCLKALEKCPKGGSYREINAVSKAVLEAKIATEAK